MRSKIFFSIFVSVAFTAQLFAGGTEETTGNNAVGLSGAGGYYESPMLTPLVASGDLPVITDRLPENPLVITPLAEAGETLGKHGGTLTVTGLDPNGDSFGGDWGDGGGYRNEGLATLILAQINSQKILLNPGKSLKILLPLLLICVKVLGGLMVNY